MIRSKTRLTSWTKARATYPDAFWVDLLKADEYRRYLQNPERLREELAVVSPQQVVIDEVQKVAGSKSTSS